jgi:hypothetical protein
MARHNEINVGHFNRFLQKFTGIKGPAVAPTLVPEIAPTLSLFSGVENRYIAGWNRYGGVAVATNVAAQTSGCSFLNPIGSNIIAVWESVIIFASAVSSNFFIEVLNGGLTLAGAGGPPFKLDFRTQSTAMCILNTGNNLAQGLFNVVKKYQWGGAQLGQIEVIAYKNQEMTALPGDVWRVRTDGVNIQLTVVWTWRERFLEESERT